MNLDVLCIGHAACDVSLFVDSYPPENSKCETHESLEGCGGPAANAAWLLSSWGLRAGFAGLVGDDVYGRRARDELEAVGTNVSLMELRSGHVTPLSMILVNRENGSRTIINRKAGATALSLDAGAVRALSPRVLLFDGHELGASLTAMREFPDAVSILDAGSWREGTATLASKVQYLAASERFALQATGMANLKGAQEQQECLRRLRSQFGTRTIVTLGERGLIYDVGDGFDELPAFSTAIVDTTAAGDIFHGAFAFGVARGMPLREVLRLASMAGSLSVRKPGGRSSAPTLAEVEEALCLAP
ncbi:carbohydrate kinase family protein [Prosthecobacter sp.]|uniref:carbohydrate kinase family protein n=1 Tax=Prosthecobacter sp. TaxID=1965333 RepID=UPI00378425EE